MRKLLLMVFCVVGLCAMGTASDDDVITLRADMRGAHEVPAINSNGTATFRATVHPDGTINFKVTFANLSSNPTLSHLHFGERHVPGGVMIFLCGGDSQPACPAATSGSFEGTITAANVTGPANQGISAGDLASALRAIRQGAAYANLHSVKFPGGELRGQVTVHRGDDDRDDR
jgi:CHRD domain-containing protein